MPELIISKRIQAEFDGLTDKILSLSLNNRALTEAIERRNKEISALKNECKKMKCCGNCLCWDISYNGYGGYCNKINKINQDRTFTCNNWEGLKK